MFFKRWQLLLLAWGPLFVIGCGSSGPNLPEPVAVSGTVLMDGKPLSDAIITFVPADKGMGQGANAVTDSSGNYELVTAIGKRASPGAIPGKYKVAISRLIGVDGSPIVLDPAEPPANSGARESLPPRFSNAMMTELKADVGDDGGAFDFKVMLR